MVRRVIKRKFKIGIILVLAGSAAFLSWNWRNEVKYSFKVRFEEVVDFGFEAFASDDWLNAEEILSSLFDKFGNELNLFRKMDRRRQMKARSLYGYLLFRKGNFKKSEMVWRPIFKNTESMNKFVLSSKSQRKILLFYLTDLLELKKFREMLRVFNLCYDDRGNPSEILQKFGDTPLMHAMAGESFHRNAEYEKVAAVLKVFFENAELDSELNNHRKAMIKWHYVNSLFCVEKDDFFEKNGIILRIFAEFFDKNMNPTKLFDELSEEDQTDCRVAYAQILLQSGDHKNILNLLKVFFDDKGQILRKFKDPDDEATVRNIYGYALWKCKKYAEAKQILSQFTEEENEKFKKNDSSDENDLLKDLHKNIRLISV